MIRILVISLDTKTSWWIIVGDCSARNSFTFYIEIDVKISSANFVAQNAGKLRDYYRIGKMLGSGRLTTFMTFGTYK